MTRNYARRLCNISIIWWMVAGSGISPAAGTSNVKSQETLVWSDEFDGSTSASQPDPRNWTYDIGAGGWGNNEMETYCAFGSAASPCDPKHPNAYVGSDGYLHIVARKSPGGVYTSARLKTAGLQSFKYGRIEARVKIPDGQGLWPAFWGLGDDITTVGWPACGEIDIMETIGTIPSTNTGSLHGTGFIGTNIGATYTLANHAKLLNTFHTYGILWMPGKIQFYVDDPANVYVTYTPSNIPKTAIWPFDSGFYFILNLAVGGYWAGPPDSTTAFPKEMLVDYVRVYAEPKSQ
jgi:beta-glucanase (GH16 family)